MSGRPGAVSTPAPHFMIVGSPRSGTTLVQRLAAELTRVSIPPETHLFPWLHDRGVLASPWPAGPADHARLAQAYAASPAVHGLGLTGAAIMEAAGGALASPVHMLDAVVRALAPGGDVIGEKTPQHLLWWEPIRRARPDMAFVAVVRDPRAVVHSQAELLGEVLGSGVDVVRLARQWVDDQQLVRELVAGAGALVLHYEEVVADPAATRDAIAAHIDVSAQNVPLESTDRLYLDREHWKHRATQPVDRARSVRWRAEMHERDIALIEAVCADTMGSFGYRRESTHHAAPEADEAYEAQRAAQARSIAAASLGPAAD